MCGCCGDLRDSIAAPYSAESLHERYSSHIVFIPLLAGLLIWSGRETIFANTRYSLNRALQIGASGIVVVALAFAFGSKAGPVWLHCLPCSCAFADRHRFCRILRNDCISESNIRLFVAVDGSAHSQPAHRPGDPIPTGGSADHYVDVLSAGCSGSTGGVCANRAGGRIEIAKECSGINSSIALLIIMLLVAYEICHSNWRRIALVIVVIPLSIIKNAIRIVTLTMLATHVDPSFLTGRLHHEGGFVFYLISLALVYPIWKLLQKTEKVRATSSVAPQEVLTTT